MKGPLAVRPIHRRLEDRVSSHLQICMLGEYVRWHLRHAWAKLRFQDDTPRSNADPGRQDQPARPGRASFGGV